MSPTTFRPIIWTDNLQETRDFYGEKLGFFCDTYDQELGWARFVRNEVELMAAVPNELVPFEGSKFMG